MADQLNRTCFQFFADWLNRKPSRKPLLIRGARQIGKTTSVRLFAERQGLDLIECNMEKPWDFLPYIERKDPKKIIEALEFQLNRDLDPERSLIFFDEIQACPGLIAVLRYFYEEAPEYAVMATGSLLEFALAEPQFSLPVGRIELFHMQPFSFEEFLQALEQDKALDFIQNYELSQDIPLGVHHKLTDLVRQYCIIGGMPESICSYKSNLNLRDVERIKATIIETFGLDFHKYSPRANIKVLKNSFDYLPASIGKKMVYSHVDPHIKTAEVSNAIDQLALAKLITKVYHTSANGIPLGAEKNEKYYKILFLDVGLLMTQLFLKPIDLTSLTELNFVNAGDIAEQFIGQQLLFEATPYKTSELYYWARERKGASAEVDYLSVDFSHNIIPIEVKSGKTGSLRSLQTIMLEKKLPRAVRFNSDLPSQFKEARVTPKGSVSYTLVSLPHYLVQQM
jgi:uncharacterized protein